MRLASVLAYLALAAICLAFENVLKEMAGLPFAAGPASLSANTAWIGLFAFAFQVWFLASFLDFVAAAVNTLLPVGAKRLDTALSYRATSFTQLWRKDSRWTWAILAAMAVRDHGFNAALVAGFGIHALLIALERSIGKGRALWHRLPGFFAGVVTLLALLVSLLLIHSAGLGHAWQFARALVGFNSLSETTLLLNAQLFTDFNVLILLASTFMVFALPPLPPLIETAGLWKRIPALLILLMFTVSLALPSIHTRVRSWLANGLGKGSNGVVPGAAEWLFDQRELRALTGAGPLEADLSAHGSPSSKARDEILAFARSLKERGVPLLLIPIPMKVSLYPEALTRSDPDDSEAPLYHASQPAFYEQLAKEGIDVQDITSAFMQLKKRHQDVFFPQDSHWTPEAMQDIARAIAVHVRKQYPGLVPADPLIVDTRAPDASSYGDLAERLYPLPELATTEESKVLVSFPDLRNDPDSSITLLGDDWVRIFDDQSLGFAAGPGCHASFAQHLALYLGKRIDTIAINGGAATAVRKEFASRFDDVVKAKKLVIWLISARDLMLPAGAGVDWSGVEFNTQSSPPDVLSPMVRQ